MKDRIAKPLEMLPGGQELTRHNIPGLALTIYNSDFSEHNYDYIDWHWHVEFQFCLVLNGTVCFRVDQHPYVIGQGDGIFINSQHVHMSSPFHNAEAAYFCAVFHPDFICPGPDASLYRSYVQPVLQNGSLSAFPLYAKDERHKTITESLAKMNLYFKEKQGGYELDLSAELLRAWKGMFLLLPPGKTGQEEPADRDRLKQILLFIQKRYAEPLSLNQIAEHIHLSRSECCRYFRRATGQSLFEYLSQYRVDKSMELLAHTSKKISEIAVEAGFGSQSYFTECFRKQKKITPLRFRQLQQR